MSYETFILVEHVDYPSLTTEYSAPVKGAGYNLANSLHSFTYELENFIGNIIIQGSLALTPAHDDWVDIGGTEFIADRSTDIAFDNFEGNFVWIRAKYIAESGIIHKIRCNM